MKDMPDANRYGILLDMKRLIAYFHSSATEASRQKVDGAYAAAHVRDWTIIRFDMLSPESVRSMAKAPKLRSG